MRIKTKPAKVVVILPEQLKRTNDMNERTMNGYFSKETAERLPNESRRRELLCQEVRELKAERAKFQKELDEYLDSPEWMEYLRTSDDLNDERVLYGVSLMDKIDEIGADIARKNHSIERLDEGETLADIYKSIFG